MELPLEGMVVLDFSRLLPGPYATMLLADLGARVILVEECEAGDAMRQMPPMDPELGVSAKYRLLNRRKERIALNLKTEGGRAAARCLARRADVLVEGFRPGVMARLGLAYEALSAENPGLIYCSISGFGQTGPYRHRAGHDLNYMAVAGALSLSGGLDRPPDPPGVQVADLGGGALMAVTSILAALMQRQRTGRGQHLDVAMVDGVMSWLSIHAADALALGRGQRPGERYLGGDFACYRVYETLDGRYLSIGAVEPHFWRNLCDAVGLPEWKDAQYAPDPVRTQVIAAFETVFRARTLDEWSTRLSAVDTCWAPVLDVHEALTGEHARARGMVRDDGEGPYLRFPVPLAGMEGTPEVQPSAERWRIGADTERVLCEAGYSAEEIAKMRASGAIA
ncbi:MAG: CoA transferase [Alicyclobacillus macrosporangiidus]|uniref:CaiB/BaiF CoA transferase family protein n=1 Tax=Alicyclobacillus macrosporangiidus TaxID=392015 RepID=UPI0026F369FE|nr:CaiB/BaiF CoA-transferase family protein [Alicyclobacillus macrosporangiidus]MCL6598615.1 CoA transferase [Alicyclobacillus macrosporangiidus]